MKKVLKWVLYIFGGIVVLFLAAAFIIPPLFKDDIRAAVVKEVEKSVNAEVYFDDVSLSLFTNFPNITAGLEGLGVVNRAPFDGQILFATKKFEVEVNLSDILFGDELRVKGISLVDPIINIHVLKDGRANYDIAVPSADTVATEEEAGEFSFGIDHWRVINGDVSYVDESLPYSLHIRGMNHTGNGDFTQAAFDLRTKTQADSVTTAFDGVEYLTNKKVDIDATINISEDFSRYAFRENNVKVNDFVMQFEGEITMKGDDIGMDLSFSTPDNSFKSLLSLVPGIYTQDFDKIRTEGELAFNGSVKGVYNAHSMPGFALNLLVKDAMFQYPDLPTAIKNINVDLAVDNPDGVIENTVVDLRNMHLDFGSNPVDARAKITKMYPTQLDASVAARLNLDELTSMFPIEGLEMRGVYALNVKAEGVYDSLKKTLPSIDAAMSLANGYIKSSEFPIPLDQMQFTSTVRNTAGQMATTVIDVKDFSMLMDGEKLAADLRIENLDNYTWDLKVNGGIDLEKITKVFPLEGITMAGKIKANLQTKGKYSDLEAERYDRLPTSGTATATEFRYAMEGMPEVRLAEASVVFDPKKIELKKLEGGVGRSDFNATGSLANYLGFVMGNGMIRGDVAFRSNLLDLNEFMTEESETETTDTTSFGVIPVPKNIDFVFRSNVRTVKMMDLDITNASGDIVVKDGVADLRNLKFNMLGGGFVVNGTYDTRDIDHPRYALALKIDNLSMQDAANASSIVRTYAPVAGLVNGKFSTDFKLSGELNQEMMPELSTVNGEGLIKIAQAALTQSKLISGVTSLTKLSDTDEVTMKDVLMSATLTNGKLSVKPFDVKFGNYKTTVAGATSLDGTIDYTLKMDVPAGKLGSDFNALVSQYTGSATNQNSTIPLTIGLKGTFSDPSPSLIMDEQKAQAKEALTNVAKEEGKKAIEEVVKGTEVEKALNKALGKDPADTTSTAIPTTKEEVKKEVEEAREEVKKKVEDEAKKKIQNLLRKKDN